MALAVVAAVWVALAFSGGSIYAPPPPRGTETPANEFSAQRAWAILEDLVGDGIPHPADSPQNAAVRQRILKRLREYGYEPQVQFTHARVTRSGNNNRTVPSDLALNNIAVRLPGRQPGRAILLAAHYDSVRWGPGASDDGASVAALLEIARMMRALPPARNDVIFLFTDGEEDGLLGAREFVKGNALAKDVKVAINFEARGTSGPSMMFETSEDSAWLISLFARHVLRPVTSSLYYEFYKRLPNDTDFTIFKQSGIEGYNFAFIRYVQNYHTKSDDLQHADAGSLQHQGDNAWQMLSALADFDLDRRKPGTAVFTDVLARFVIWWPASISRALAGSILAAVAAAAAAARRRGLFARFRWRSFAVAFLPLLVASLFALCVGVRGNIRSAHPVWGVSVYWILAFVAAILALRLTPLGRIDAWNAWAAVWLCWNALALATAWFAPGASFLTVIPGALSGAAGLLAAALPKRAAAWGLLVACCAGPLAAGVLWIPMQYLLYDSVGFQLNPLYAVCAGLVVMTVLPLQVVPRVAETAG